LYCLYVDMLSLKFNSYKFLRSYKLKLSMPRHRGKCLVFNLAFKIYQQRMCDEYSGTKHTNLLLGLSTVPTSDAWWWYPVPTPTRLPVPIEIGCDTAWSVKDKCTWQYLCSLLVIQSHLSSKKKSWHDSS